MQAGTTSVTLLFAAVSLFPLRAPAQQAEPQTENMMSKDMMAQHRMMMTQHQEMGKLIDQLLQGVSALENEKDPVRLKKELAEHAGLLRELQNKFRQNSAMMETEQTSEHSLMMQRGEKTMGFSQTETTHHFFSKKDGGVIQVEANDPKDTRNRDMIRTHLAHIAQAFAAGDFSSPLGVHGKVPDGVPVMERLKGDIRYTFEPTPQGGRVVITTANPEALEAIHQFLRFQVREHRTGDAVN